MQGLSHDRIIGVETGGCPHTAIREDASVNLAAVAELTQRHPGVEIVLIESGGDNLSATFSPELADLSIYVIDRRRRRGHSAQGRSGHHPFGHPGRQQDRPRAPGRRPARCHGTGCTEDAGRTADGVRRTAGPAGDIRHRNDRLPDRAGWIHRCRAGESGSPLPVPPSAAGSFRLNARPRPTPAQPRRPAAATESRHRSALRTTVTPGRQALLTCQPVDT